MKMNLKKVAAQATIAGALGFSALGLGVDVGAASADPGRPCGDYCQGGPQNQRGDGDGGYRGDGRDAWQQDRDYGGGWQQGPPDWAPPPPDYWAPPPPPDWVPSLCIPFVNCP